MDVTEVWEILGLAFNWASLLSDLSKVSPDAKGWNTMSVFICSLDQQSDCCLATAAMVSWLEDESSLDGSFFQLWKNIIH